jgi:CelD/BcsL family acetyltransferase involved in cellulose biosynthesis
MPILRVYESMEELSALRPGWEELLLQYPLSTTFSTWEWLSSWWSCFGDHRQLLVLALFDESSLVGLAPLSISKEQSGKVSLRVLRLMSDGSGDSDSLDFPVQPGFENAFAEAIIHYLREQRQHWDVCFLNTLPFDSLVAKRLASILRSTWWTFIEYSSMSSAVNLPESWELYCQKLASEDRRNLIRYTRRLESRYATRIYRCGTQDQLPDCLEALFRLHQKRWQTVGEPGSFSSPQRRRFYTLLSQRLLDCRCLELWVLELDGVIAAVQFAFRFGEKVFQLQEGYDRLRSSDRPGLVLRGAVLKQLISERVRVYDFLGGEDKYKARWGAQQGRYQQFHFAPTFGLGGIWLHWVDKTAKGKEWLRAKSPHSVWRMLQKAKVAVRGKSSEQPENYQSLR